MYIYISLKLITFTNNNLYTDKLHLPPNTCKEQIYKTTQRNNQPEKQTKNTKAELVDPSPAWKYLWNSRWWLLKKDWNIWWWKEHTEQTAPHRDTAIKDYLFCISASFAQLLQSSVQIKIATVPSCGDRQLLFIRFPTPSGLGVCSTKAAFPMSITSTIAVVLMCSAWLWMPIAVPAFNSWMVTFSPVVLVRKFSCVSSPGYSWGLTKQIITFIWGQSLAPSLRGTLTRVRVCRPSVT